MMDWMSLLSRGRQPMGYGGPQAGGMAGMLPQAQPQMGGMMGGMGQPQPQQGAYGMLGNMVAQPRGAAGRGGGPMLGLLRRA